MKAYKTEATVLFCDIRNFTNLLEARDSIDAVEFANSVLAVLGEEVENNEGVHGRFTGDGFLAHFGAFTELENHALAACNSAIAMRTCLQDINKRRYLQVESVINTGIAIHTGTIAVGEITSGRTTQQTVLGDVVNTSARLEELTKKHLRWMCWFQIPHMKRYGTDTNFKKMPLKKLRGKQQRIQSWWLLPVNGLE
ncbi:MAG: adenylate/guanylate cyclase domain-containing protein [Balneolaceae bacterium]|nr:adenylate/guanylate cyclase domain-containing protein [Balneolaceae bacterium]